MFRDSTTFGSFSVDSLATARKFYNETLGIDIDDEGEMGLRLKLAGNRQIYVYPKKDHTPASFTVLNFIVDDLDSTMTNLEKKGIKFLHYNRTDLPQDERGVLRGRKAGRGPDIAWFEDPAGNVLSVLQEK